MSEFFYQNSYATKAIYKPDNSSKEEDITLIINEYCFQKRQQANS